MLSTADLILHLSSSLLFSTLKLTVQPLSNVLQTSSPYSSLYDFDDRFETIFEIFDSIVAKKKSTIFALYRNHLLIDRIPALELKNLQLNEFTMRLKCDHNSRLYVNVTTVQEDHYLFATVICPQVCTKYSKSALHLAPVGPTDQLFVGCLSNVTLAKRVLLDSWCRNETDASRPRSFTRSIQQQADDITSAMTTASASEDDDDDISDLVHVGERLKVNEGGTTRLQFKNVYLFPGHKRYGIDDYSLVKFEIVSQPEHGRFSLLGVDNAVAVASRVRLRVFSYDDLLNERVEYRHDGSEASADTFDVQLKIETRNFQANEALREKQLRIYTLFIDVESVDDSPQIRAGFQGPVVYMAVGGRVRLGEAHLRVWDADTPTRKVWIRAQRAVNVVVVDVYSRNLTRFSLAQLLNGEIYLASEGGEGEVEFSLADDTQAANTEARASVHGSLKLRITSIAVSIHQDANSGVELAHRSSCAISAQSLSFHSNFGAEIPIRYAIVDQPEFGIIECLQSDDDDVSAKSGKSSRGAESTAQAATHSADDYQICANFEQGDVDNTRVRYRHTSENRPQTDSFGFQVHCGTTSTPVYVFHVNFIPIRFRVFTRDALLLNNTQLATITARNLLATALPKTFSPEQLVYHIIEPPKYGMLSRRIYGSSERAASARYRRIGVSSNFTQQHVNDAALQYKMHFVQYAPVSDYFSFRLLTPAVTSELMRFEITFVPGPNSIRLINRTLILAEGATQKLTNNTIWLETSDESHFRFVIVVAPFNGRLALADSSTGALSYLGADSAFTSADIAQNRVVYEHDGDETRHDSMHFVAQSVAQHQTRIPFWLSVSIIAENDNTPRLRRQFAEDDTPLVIPIVEESERVLYSSLMPWRDADSTNVVAKETDTTSLSTSLSFHFPELFRDFIICTREFPELSVRNFTQLQLNDRSLIVRHLNLKKSVNKLKYTISDGRHTVASTLKFVASAAFIRTTSSRMLVTHSALLATNLSTNSLNGKFLLLTSAHLAAETNLDVDIDAIRFERLHAQRGGDDDASPFYLLNQHDGALRPTNAFEQRDIFAKRIFLALTFIDAILTDLNNNKSRIQRTTTATTNSLGMLTIPLRIFATSNAVAAPTPRFSLFSFSSAEERRSATTRLSADVTFSVDFEASSSTVSATLASKTLLLTQATTDDGSALECASASSIVIDANAFGAVALSEHESRETTARFDAKFFVIEAPKYGALSLRKPSTVSDLNLAGEKGPFRSSASPPLPFNNNNNVVVEGIRQSEIEARQLHYVHYGQPNDEAFVCDAITVNLLVTDELLADGGTTVIGPLRIDIRILDANQLLLIPSTDLSVEIGANLTLRASHLRLSLPSAEADFNVATIEYRIMHAPRTDLAERYGYLAIRDRANLTRPIHSAFQHVDLIAGNVIFIGAALTQSAKLLKTSVSQVNDAYANLDAKTMALEWELRACTSSIRQAKCSSNARFRIKVKGDNKYRPKIVRNEVLVISEGAKKTPLTSSYLQALDNDTPPFQLKYLIWKVNGGVLKRKYHDMTANDMTAKMAYNDSEASADVWSFTQAELDSSRIYFALKSSNKTNGSKEEDDKLGFQFLVTDGRHQSRPATFAIVRAEHTTSETAAPKQLDNENDVASAALDVVVDANAQLSAAPGIAAKISNEMLRARITNASSSEVVFRLMRPPFHGRLVVEGGGESSGPVDAFTQADVDAGRVRYRSAFDLGAWFQRDFFNFVVESRAYAGRRSSNEMHSFKIYTSFANVKTQELDEFLSRQGLLVGNGGSVMLNAKHLNLTRLAALCDDALFIRVLTRPMRGRIARITDVFSELKPAAYHPSSGYQSDNEFDNDNIEDYDNNSETDDSFNSSSTSATGLSFGMNELEFGRDIIYQHYSTPPYISGNGNEKSRNDADNEENDALLLRVYPLRENYKRANSLEIPLRIRVLKPADDEILETFPEKLDIVSGGRLLLSAEQFRITSSRQDEASLMYRLIQAPSDGLRFIRLTHPSASSSAKDSLPVAWSEVEAFSQADVNRGNIALDHYSAVDFFDAKGDDESDAKSRFGVIVLQIGGAQTRVLPIRVVPLALRLVNHTKIELPQGRTYVLLNRNHLDVASNNDRVHVIYNITRAPVNGSLYWVAGETQAHAFSQKNVDDGEILYAQLNMNAYQDSFGFVLSDAHTELLERESRVVVTALIQPRAFATKARTITQIGVAYFNVSQIKSIAPQFVVLSAPKWGRLFLRANANASASSFTATDVLEGNLFFHSFNANKQQLDEVMMELLADGVQPARLIWTIDIRPADENVFISSDAQAKEPFPGVFIFPTTIPSLGNVPPSKTFDYDGTEMRPVIIDNRAPILILIGVVGVVVLIALCHWRASAKKEKKRSASLKISTSDAAAVDDDNDSGSAGGGRAIPGIGPIRQLPDLSELIAPSASAASAKKAFLEPVVRPRQPRGILTNSKSRLSETKSDLFKSTIYATIGSPNNYAGYVRESLDVGSAGEKSCAKPKNVTLAVSSSEADSGSDEMSDDAASRSAAPLPYDHFSGPLTAALRSMSNARRRTLATVDENCAVLHRSSAAQKMTRSTTEFGALERGYHEETERAAPFAAPLIALNPTARRFMLPTRRPVAVSAVIPSGTSTFDAAESVAYVHAPNLNKIGFVEATKNSLLSRTISSGSSFPLLQQQEQQRQHIPPFQQQMQLLSAASLLSNSGNEDDANNKLSNANAPPLKENEYWV